jgi:hypothetical protein
MNEKPVTSRSTSPRFRRIALLATMLATATVVAVPHLTAQALKIWAGVIVACYLARLNSRFVQSL